MNCPPLILFGLELRDPEGEPYLFRNGVSGAPLLVADRAVAHGARTALLRAGQRPRVVKLSVKIEEVR